MRTPLHRTLTQRCDHDMQQWQRLRMGVIYSARAVGSTEVIQAEEGEVRRDGPRVWWKVGDVEVLSDPAVHITVDRAERTVTVRPPADAPPSFTDTSAFIGAIEGVVGRCDRATSEEASGRGEIRLSCPVSSYSEVRIGYRTADHLIDRLVLTTGASPALASGAPVELEIRYRDIGTTITDQEAPPSPEQLLPLAAGGSAVDLDGYALVDLRAGVVR